MKEETKETMEKARETIPLIADKLKERYNPEKIILYGSYAWGLSDKDRWILHAFESPIPAAITKSSTTHLSNDKEKGDGRHE
ncbi:MAG: hypothetical protein QMD22_00590 [archaeon]|nr:hypothetical protein [archaeon]